MATNIDKALFQQPTGIEQLSQDELPIEVEIVDPEEVTIRADGLEIEIEKAEPTAEDFDANLAEFMDESAMDTMASTLAGDIDNDKNSRKEWEKTYTEGLKLLGLQYEERTEPWDGACGVYSPVLTEAAVRFQAESIMETFPASGPVKTQIIGAIDEHAKGASAKAA